MSRVFSTLLSRFAARAEFVILREASIGKADASIRDGLHLLDRWVDGANAPG